MRTEAERSSKEAEERPQKPRLVIIGGGSGTSSILWGLRPYFSALETSVIVTTFDSGGSSGILREAFAGTPAEQAGLGDFRQIILALAPDEMQAGPLAYWEDRPPANGHATSELNGLCLGNYHLLTMVMKEGSLHQALQKAHEIYKLQGTILPVTEDLSHLWALTRGGKELYKEHEIDSFMDTQNDPIVRMELRPPARLPKYARDAIRNADIVIISPGSLWTSVLPNFLVRGTASAVKEAQERGAKVIAIPNVMSEAGHGEPYGYSVSNYLEKLREHILPEQRFKIDGIIVHNGRYPEELLPRYRKEGKYPVRLDTDACRVLFPNVQISTGDFLSVSNKNRIRHNRAVGGVIYMATQV